jgi:peptide/nickel transport system substrate-binding protein
MSENDENDGGTLDELLENPFSRRRLLEAGGAGAAALLFAGSLGGVARAAVKPKRGGSLTWGLLSDPATLAPFGVGNTSSVETKNLVYESLVSWNKGLDVIPALATSWTTPNRSTYIFKLRKGVKFHSGKPFSAEDVKYSFDLQKTPPAPGTVTAFYPKIASIDIVDDYTVKFNMSQPDGSLIGYCAWLAYSYIVPKGLYDRIDPRSQADGTGPFKLVSYTPNDSVVLTRNTGYWNKTTPYLDKLTLKVLTDEQSRLAALTSGAIDGATFTPDAARTLNGNSSVTVLKGPTAAFKEIQFNLKDRSKPWANVLVRRAMNYAINRQEIIDKVYGGQGQYSSKIPPVYGKWPVSQSDLHKKWQRYDLVQAKKLMRIAGYTNGFSVTLQTIANPNEYVQIAQIVAAQLAKIGIKVTVQPLEIGTFATNNSTGNFDMCCTGRGMRGDPSGYFTDFDPQGSTYKAWFQGGYRNDKLTNLIYDGLAENNQAKRFAIYKQAQEIVLSQLPTMPLVDPVKYQAVRTKVKGMYVSQDDTERGLPQVWES